MSDRETYPALIVELDGERGEFAAFADPNQWALLQNAEAAKERSNTANMAAIYKLAITSVLHRERPRFEEFMMEHGHDPNLIDTLTTALNALWTGETRLPLEPSSSDSPTPTSENGATSMDDSSPVESVQAEPVRENLEIVGTSVEQSPTEPSVESGSFTPDLI